MSVGIYCYKDTFKDNNIIYVGKDSHIDENARHKRHMFPSSYDDQQINRVLQNNPNRYEYCVLKEGNFSENLLNALEIIYIRRYSPKFNYTIGGDGMTGYTHSEESKNRISNALKGHEVSKETREKLSQFNKGHIVSKETRKKLSKIMDGANNPSYRHDVPSGESLFFENRNGVTYKELCKKYDCYESLIISRIRKYKKEQNML